MPIVESHITMRAPLALVWELAQDVQKFPDIMPDLDMVRVLERQVVSPVMTRVVSEWHGRIKQLNRRLNWTEEDIWNSEDHTCHFWQLMGDWNEYGGDWSFVEEDGGTAAHLKVDYRFEIPLMGAFMQKVIQKLVQQNSDEMLQCLCAEAERRTKEAD